MITDGRRTKGDPALLAARIAREINTLAPDLPIADLRTVRQSLTGIFGYFMFQIGAVQAAGMGLLGLALALGALATWPCYLPAQRATRVPAMTALRHE